MVINPGKCYYMNLSLNTIKNEFDLEDATIVPSAEEHIVSETTVDAHFTFYSHLKQLCKKIANKLSALTRIAP